MQHGEIGTIERRSETVDAYGAETLSWTTGKRFWIWLQDAGSALVERYARMHLNVTHKAYMAVDPDAQEGDRIRLSNNVRLLIHGIENQAGMDQVWRLVLEQQSRSVEVSSSSSDPSSSTLSSSSSSLSSSTSSDSSSSTVSVSSSSSSSTSSYSSESSSSSSTAAQNSSSSSSSSSSESL